MAGTEQMTLGAPLLKVKRCFELGRSRQRVLLTGVGGLLLFWASWHWGRPEMARWSLGPGALLATSGLMLRMWATGWLCKNEVLTTQGPYAYTRNPLYLGTFLLTLGHALMSGIAIAPLLFSGILLALYWPTMRKEEQYLRERHGTTYERYQQQVPRFLPRLVLRRKPSADSATQSFHWPRVRRCYKGFIANAVVITIYVLINASR